VRSATLLAVVVVTTGRCGAAIHQKTAATANSPSATPATLLSDGLTAPTFLRIRIAVLAPDATNGP